VPPLRERRNEIAHLAEFFVHRYACRYNRPSRQLSPQLQELFQSYDWPGNIRELENMIKRIVILQDEQIVVREMTRADRLVPAYAAAASVPPPSSVLPEVEPEEFDIDEEEREPQPEGAQAGVPPASRLSDVAKAAAMKAERALIEDTLHQVHWNRRRAAGQLGVSYKTLLNKIKESGISKK
jgi:two-component system response regulator AtoC